MKQVKEIYENWKYIHAHLPVLFYVYYEIFKRSLWVTELEVVECLLSLQKALIPSNAWSQKQLLSIAREKKKNIYLCS